MRFQSKRVAETVLVSVDFSDQLAADEDLSGTPTAVEIGSSDLDISGIEINDDDLTVNYRTAAANKVVSFLVGGGVRAAEYTIRVTAESDEGQTLIKDVNFRVN